MTSLRKGGGDLKPFESSSQSQRPSRATKPPKRMADGMREDEIRAFKKEKFELQVKNSTQTIPFRPPNSMRQNASSVSDHSYAFQQPKSRSLNSSSTLSALEGHSSMSSTNSSGRKEIPFRNDNFLRNLLANNNIDLRKVQKIYVETPRSVAKESPRIKPEPTPFPHQFKKFVAPPPIKTKAALAKNVVSEQMTKAFHEVEKKMSQMLAEAKREVNSHRHLSQLIRNVPLQTQREKLRLQKLAHEVKLKYWVCSKLRLLRAFLVLNLRSSSVRNARSHRDTSAAGSSLTVQLSVRMSTGAVDIASSASGCTRKTLTTTFTAVCNY